tara:strand:+ start:4109 stop:4672 length:564 start_codon:yes stop_codon:yes gene_type:complete
MKKVIKKEKPSKLVRGQLVGDKVVIKEDFQNALEFYDKGRFGKIQGVKEKQLELALVEALYLAERKKIKILSGKKELKLEQVLAKAQRGETNFWNRWRVYRDFRARGYVLKTALKFGADFRVYRRGMKPGEDHAKWVLFCVSENQKESWREFSAKMRVAHSTRKTLLIGCVDDEGDVTYWEVRWRKP